MHILALIPARGGSKGLPRKNLQLLGGKPLIAYPIADALASQHITRTIVSTEDAEIAAAAQRYGAEVPFSRPPELAKDETPDLPVFQHALRWLHEYGHYTPELIVHLRATTPLRDPGTIDAAIQRMLAHPEADALRSVSRPTQNPYKMWTAEGDYLRPLLQLAGIVEPYNQPRQRLPEVYWQNGYIDIIRPRVIGRNLMTGATILSFLIEETCIEIDYEDSLREAEILLELRARGKRPVTASRHAA